LRREVQVLSASLCIKLILRVGVAFFAHRLVSLLGDLLYVDEIPDVAETADPESSQGNGGLSGDATLLRFAWTENSRFCLPGGS